MAINWYPGHMAKTKREIKEKLALIDIVFEIIDARIPYSSKNKEIAELIKDKPRILIMTKFDLCDKEVTNKWCKYYEQEGYKPASQSVFVEEDDDKEKIISLLFPKHTI